MKIGSFLMILNKSRGKRGPVLGLEMLGPLVPQKTMLLVFGLVMQMEKAAQD